MCKRQDGYAAVTTFSLLSNRNNLNQWKERKKPVDTEVCGVGRRSETEVEGWGGGEGGRGRGAELQL